MALSDKFTRSEIRAAALREIMDTGTRFVSTAEMNDYADEWQYMVQLDHELIWAAATHTHTGSSTIALTDIATDILRPGYVWWYDANSDSTAMLFPRTKDELNVYDPHWYEGSATNTLPVVVFQETIDDLVVWPFLTSGTWTFVLEYPVAPTFAADTSTHEVPAWTRYSALPYMVWRCYERNGSIHNPAKAQRYQEIYEDASARIARIARQRWPKKAPAMRPVVEYENRILQPRGLLDNKYL